MRWKRRKIPVPVEDAIQAADVRDPFEAVPHLAKGVQVRRDSQGHLQIRKEIEPKPGLSDLLARKLKLRRDVRVNLDDRGTFYWEQIDGKAPLREIEKRMRRKFKLKQDESRKATIVFTKSLMLRHLVLLELSNEYLGIDTKEAEALKRSASQSPSRAD